MKYRKLISCLLCGCLPALWAGTAAAEDAPFTIRVPVELRDVHPDVQGGEINCQVEDAQGLPVAGGTVPFSIDRKTRTFNATVPVSARLASGRSPTDARNYQCTLWLNDGNTRSLAYAPGAQSNAKFEASPGTPFTPIVRGPISSSVPGVTAPTKPVKGTNIRR